jgi:peroxiredoxin family protein
MPAEAAAGKPAPDKLSLVIFSGAFDRVHYALSMAAAALAINTPATLFFTMGAIRALLPVEGGKGGWRDLLPTEDGIAAGKADAQLIARKLAGFEEMLAACVSLGATVMVCEMGMRAMGLEGAVLRGDVPVKAGGLVTFLTDASRDGALVFV